MVGGGVVVHHHDFVVRGREVLREQAFDTGADVRGRVEERHDDGEYKRHAALFSPVPVRFGESPGAVIHDDETT